MVQFDFDDTAVLFDTANYYYYYQYLYSVFQLKVRKTQGKNTEKKNECKF